MLHLAASRGHKEVCEFLVQHGADIEATNADVRARTHLWLRPCSLSPQGVHSCLCFRHQQHSTPLHRASWGGRLSVINFLISAGANVNAVKPNKDTALHLAGYQNHAECVAALLAAGADPNASKTVRSTASAFPPPLVFPQAAPDVTLRMCGGVPTERRHNAACGVPKGQHCCCTSSRGRRS